MLRIVGIGEYQISNRSEDIIKTYALGSCVAITMYSRKNKVLCMAHIVLPDSKIMRVIGKEAPYFADTAVPFLVNKMIKQYGCNKSDIIVYLFGGAVSRAENDVFCIGEKNVESVIKSLAKENLAYDMVNTGEHVSRTVEMYVESGKYKILAYPLSY